MNECYMYHISMPMGHGRADGAARAGRDAALESNRKTDDGEREGNYYECLRMYEVPRVRRCVVVAYQPVAPQR